MASSGFFEADNIDSPCNKFKRQNKSGENVLIQEMDSVSKYETLQSPIKPSTDKKEYKYIKLANGLKALLISDTSYDLSMLDKEARLERIEKLRSASYGDNNAVNDFNKRLQRSISAKDGILDANGRNVEPSKTLKLCEHVCWLAGLYNLRNARLRCGPDLDPFPGGPGSENKKTAA